jgi:hypothetical protein
MAANVTAQDTDNARVALLNLKVSAAYSGVPTDPNNAVDLALGRLAANNEILGVRGTRTNP